MRILSGIVVLTLGLGIVYASRVDVDAAGAGGGAQAGARMTEADYEKIMKQVGPTNGAMRMKLMGNMLPDAAKDATQLVQLFGDVERFWTQNNKTDAVKWAQDARANATETASAASAGDGMKAQMAANNILASCKQCHGTYREMDPSGMGFRIKPGTLAP
jgi:cytochrome c556